MTFFCTISWSKSNEFDSFMWSKYNEKFEKNPLSHLVQKTALKSILISRIRGCRSFGGAYRGRNMQNYYKLRENEEIEKTILDRPTIKRPTGLRQKSARSNQMRARKLAQEKYCRENFPILVYEHAFYWIDLML